jgi:glycosyltransferase involved in cell wall biosynthesis
VRILVVSNIYPPVVRGGYEVECSGVVGLLRERGDDVRVLTSRVDGVVREDGIVVDDLHPVPSTRPAIWTAPFTAAVDRRATGSLLRSFEPDLAFVWNGAHIPHSTIYEILASGTPTAFRVCEHWFGSLFVDDYYMRYLTHGGGERRRAWSASVRLVNRLPSLRLEPSIPADVAVSWVSEFLRGAVRMPSGLRAVVERVVHPTTQHAARFAAVQRQRLPDPILAFAGRLSPEKGADVAIEALGLLVREGFDLRLVVAGGGSDTDRARLERVAAANGVTDRCEYPGRLDPDALCALYGRASVLVVPAIWQEPLPITVIEGALARIPIVASRVGGMPEALEEGIDAILSSPGDAADLAHGVREVLERPEEAGRRAESAHARALERTWEDYAAKTKAFVDDAYRALSRRA